jgi:diamine N-acetyltransferase
MIDVYLRPLQIEDAETSYLWRNDPEIWLLTGYQPSGTTTIDSERDWLISVLKNKNEKRFAICLKDSNQYIGNVQLTDIESQRAQFHIFIGEKKYWGQGIATTATELIIKYGFNVLKLNEIYLYVNRNNYPAIKVYNRCGFNSDSEKNDQICMVLRNG